MGPPTSEGLPAQLPCPLPGTVPLNATTVWLVGNHGFRQQNCDDKTWAVRHCDARVGQGIYDSLTLLRDPWFLERILEDSQDVHSSVVVSSQEHII